MSIGFRPQVAKTPKRAVEPLPQASIELHKEAKALRRDLSELRRFELIARR